jgi:Bacterial conjugation TrbI-like protein
MPMKNRDVFSAKRRFAWILLSYSASGLTGVPVRAQETRSEGKTLVVEPGNDLRAALEKGMRLRAPGQPITARLLEPVYAGQDLAIPAGSTIKGHVSAISTAPMRKRARRFLNGDFTPPKTAHVTFDQLVLSDGTMVPIHSDSVVGRGRVANSRYLPKAERPGVRQKVKGAMAPLREPNKLQRLGEAVVTSLPYHPEYIDQGTVFDAALLAPVTVLASVQPNTAFPQASDYLRLHLLTPVNSKTSTAGAQVEAVVSQPYYQADHQLLYPAGARVTGTVQKASSAGWMKRNGSIVFAFRSVQMPDGTTRDIDSTVGGIQAERSEGLDVGKEGEIKATTSTLARLLAPVSLVGPSRGVADMTTQKTAWSRSGEGRKGFGLLGAGAAQASAGTAIGFGYFGAAKRLCDAFITKGSNVELPVNTPIFLRLDSSDPSVALATR